MTDPSAGGRLRVGADVHYVTRGSADGQFEPECMAAKVTALNGDSHAVSLCVFNPNGIYFDRNVAHDEPFRSEAGPNRRPRGGTWHWPEGCEN